MRVRVPNGGGAEREREPASDRLAEHDTDRERERAQPAHRGLPSTTRVAPSASGLAPATNA